MVEIILDCETTSLDPSENGRVTCISIHNISTNKVQSFVDVQEDKLLNNFWRFLETIDSPRLITFNGSYFDLPYIVHRSIARKVKVTKYDTLDLRQVVNSFFLSYDKRVKGNLAYWAAVLGIEQKTPPGAYMIQLFMEGKLDEIRCHCEEDISITLELYKRCKEVGLI